MRHTCFGILSKRGVLIGIGLSVLGMMSPVALAFPQGFSILFQLSR